MPIWSPQLLSVIFSYLHYSRLTSAISFVYGAEQSNMEGCNSDCFTNRETEITTIVVMCCYVGRFDLEFEVLDVQRQARNGDNATVTTIKIDVLSLDSK